MQGKQVEWTEYKREKIVPSLAPKIFGCQITYLQVFRLDKKVVIEDLNQVKSLNLIIQ